MKLDHGAVRRIQWRIQELLVGGMMYRSCLLPPTPSSPLPCLPILVLRGRSQVQLGMVERCKLSRQMLSYAFG